MFDQREIGVEIAVIDQRVQNSNSDSLSDIAAL